MNELTIELLEIEKSELLKRFQEEVIDTEKLRLLKLRDLKEEEIIELKRIKI